MQDIHAIGGGRIFVGGSGGGTVVDRRLRLHNNHHNLQALNCPRCDSLNTKFCYYNNYNLSQPRHFCKNCRRYWTKGGVLRNVPIGGGCRKTKRSSKPKSASETTLVRKERHKSNSHSSSESSNLTAGMPEAVSAPVSSGSGTNTVIVPDSKLFSSQSGNSNFDSGILEQQGADCGIFSEIGSFTSLITSTNDQLIFGLNNSQFRSNQHQQSNMLSNNGDDVKIHGNISGQFLGNNVAGFGSLDWQSDGDQALFDLTNSVDQGYWNLPQWTDQYQSSVYLP